MEKVFWQVTNRIKLWVGATACEYDPFFLGKGLFEMLAPGMTIYTSK